MKGRRTFYFNYTAYLKYQPKIEYWQKLRRQRKTVATILGTPLSSSPTAFQQNHDEKYRAKNVFNLLWVSNSQSPRASPFTSFSTWGHLWGCLRSHWWYHWWGYLWPYRGLFWPWSQMSSCAWLQIFPSVLGSTERSSKGPNFAHAKTTVEVSLLTCTRHNLTCQEHTLPRIDIRVT